MQVKTLEVRDEGTCIPVLAIKMYTEDPIQRYYVHYRCGYPPDGTGIVMMRLTDQKASVDPYEWGDRTHAVAHNHIYNHFNELKDGDVVDVSFIQGETDTKKVSERFGDG